MVQSTFLGVIILELVTFGLVPAQTQSSVPKTANPATRVGLRLDAVRAQNFEVTTVDGHHISLSNLLLEGRPIVVEFWATWCAPCRKLSPVYVQLSNQYRSEGLIVIGLTIEDPETDTEKVKQYVKEHKVDYSIAFAGAEIYQFFNSGRTGRSVPRVFIFARDGSLVKQINGMGWFGTEGNIRNAVKQAIENGKKLQKSPIQQM